MLPWHQKYTHTRSQFSILRHVDICKEGKSQMHTLMICLGGGPVEYVLCAMHDKQCTPVHIMSSLRIMFAKQCTHMLNWCSAERTDQEAYWQLVFLIILCSSFCMTQSNSRMCFASPPWTPRVSDAHVVPASACTAPHSELAALHCVAHE